MYSKLTSIERLGSMAKLCDLKMCPLIHFYEKFSKKCQIHGEIFRQLEFYSPDKITDMCKIILTLKNLSMTDYVQFYGLLVRCIYCNKSTPRSEFFLFMKSFPVLWKYINNEPIEKVQLNNCLQFLRKNFNLNEYALIMERKLREKFQCSCYENYNIGLLDIDSFLDAEFNHINRRYYHSVVGTFIKKIYEISAKIFILYGVK